MYPPQTLRDQTGLGSPERSGSPQTQAATGPDRDPATGQVTPPAPGGERAAASVTPVRILIADRDAAAREHLKGLLAQHWSVEAVEDGEAALAALRRAPCDVLIADVAVSSSDFDLLRELRADLALGSTAVIVTAQRASADDEALPEGADEYLLKPFAEREALARVRTQLNKRVAERKAQESGRAKDEFIAMLGHELRNPLAPILTALQLLRMRGKEYRELQVIERQAGHLARLVDDLLDISRITRGKIELRRVRVELSSMVMRGVDQVSPLIEQRRQRLDIRVPLEGLMIEGDPDRLAQVVANLLTNAAKYSESGTTIHVTAERAGSSVRLHVRDEGVGIPRTMLGNVFDLFVQQPQSLDRARGGLGIGLTIVRNLIERHGGKVTAQSEGEGKGSDFIVELPLARRQEPLDREQRRRAPSPPPRPTSLSFGKKRILVVDDNSDAAETLAEALLGLGYEVAVAHDGPSALVEAQRFKPNLCLLDIGLPAMDGYELARRLRHVSGLPQDLRLVALTGYGQDSDRQRSQAAGFNEHVVKPVSLDVLTKVLAH